MRLPYAVSNRSSDMVHVRRKAAALLPLQNSNIGLSRWLYEWTGDFKYLWVDVHHASCAIRADHDNRMVTLLYLG